MGMTRATTIRAFHQPGVSEGGHLPNRVVGDGSRRPTGSRRGLSDCHDGFFVSRIACCRRVAHDPI
jgi:hypothetical protein